MEYISILFNVQEREIDVVNVSNVTFCLYRTYLLVYVYAQIGIGTL